MITTRKMLLVLAMFLGARASGAQQAKPAPEAAPKEITEGTPFRFQIAGAGDSTVAIALGGRTWVKKGMTGIIVDPRSGDVLIARIQLIAVDSKQGRAQALITGQTTNVTTDYIAIIDRLPTPYYKRRSFWGGFAAGAVLGLVAGLVH